MASEILRGLDVLVVEDEADIRELVRYNLEKAGYVVMGVRTPVDFLADVLDCDATGGVLGSAGRSSSNATGARKSGAGPGTTDTPTPPASACVCCAMPAWAAARART